MMLLTFLGLLVVIVIIIGVWSSPFEEEPVTPTKDPYGESKPEE